MMALLAAESKASLSDRITGPAIQLAALSGASLFLALGFQLSVAALFGTSSELDAFWIALALPKAIVDSIHLGVPTILFILIFNLPSDPADPVDAVDAVTNIPNAKDTRSQLASSVLNLLLIGTLIIVPAIVLFAPALTRLMGRGLDPIHQAEAARLLRLLSLLLVPSGLAGALAGILHAQRRFLPFAVGRAMSLAAQMVSLYVLVVLFKVRLDALAWATLAGAMVMLTCCVPGFLRTGFRYEPVLRWRGPQERAIFTVALVMVAFSMIDRLNQVVNRFAASFLDAGSISALEFGWRFEIPIVHVLSMSVALPTLAIMAGQAGEKQWTELRVTAAESIRLMTLLVIPFIGFIVVMREPLTSVWFERGAFSSGAAHRVASLLPFMGVMFLMRAFGTITVYGLLSLRKLRVLLSVLSIEAMVNIALNLLFFRPFGLQGVVLATALAMTFGNVWLGRVFLKSLHDWPFSEFAAEIKAPLLASVSSVLALAVLFRVLGVGWIGNTHLARAIELGMIGVAFFGGHLLLANRLHLVELPIGRVLPRLFVRPRRGATTSIVEPQ